jgi:Mg/Co/Ni transporter MgtE
MDTEVYTVERDRRLFDVYRALGEGSPERRQRLYPVLDADSHLVGVLPWSSVLAARDDATKQVHEAMSPPMVVAYPDEILRSVADRMASLGIGVLPVIDRANPDHLDGLVTQFNLLQARQKLLEEERHAERVLTLEGMSGRRSQEIITAGRSTTSSADETP